MKYFNFRHVSTLLAMSLLALTTACASGSAARNSSTEIPGIPTAEADQSWDHLADPMAQQIAADMPAAAPAAPTAIAAPAPPAPSASLPQPHKYEIVWNSASAELAARLFISWEGAADAPILTLRKLRWQGKRKDVHVVNAEPLTLDRATGEIRLGDRPVGLWYGHPRVRADRTDPAGGESRDVGVAFVAPIRLDPRANRLEFIAPRAPASVRAQSSRGLNPLSSSR